MRGPRLRLASESRPENAALAGDVLRALLAGTGVPTETAHAVELCVVEALNNAFEHAYECRPGQEVELSIELEDGTVVVEIADRGTAMPPGVLEATKPSPFDFDPADQNALPEGGMGLAIMKKVMDRVAYRSSAGVNTLRLEKQVSPG